MQSNFNKKQNTPQFGGNDIKRVSQELSANAKKINPISKANRTQNHLQQQGQNLAQKPDSFIKSSEKEIKKPSFSDMLNKAKENLRKK